MVANIRSVGDIYRLLPKEDDARAFLEELVWPKGRSWPLCGSDRSSRLQDKSTRPGLYQCSERECRRQLTVTTRARMHATKLDLRTWVLAL